MTLCIIINGALCLNCNREQLSLILLLGSMRKSGIESNKLLSNLQAPLMVLQLHGYMRMLHAFLQVCLGRKDAST